MYRYGFQGQEKDDEIKGEGNSLNYTFRMHDPRVGRFFAVDPLTHDYPHYTPYSFSGNKVIAHIELEGLEEISYTVTFGIATTRELLFENVLWTGKNFYSHDWHIDENSGQISDLKIDNSKPLQYKITIKLPTDVSLFNYKTNKYEVTDYSLYKFEGASLDEMSVKENWKEFYDGYWDAFTSGLKDGFLVGLSQVAIGKIVNTTREIYLNTLYEMYKKEPQLLLPEGSKSPLLLKESSESKKTDFIVTPNGTATSTDLSKVSRSYEQAGFPKVQSTENNSIYVIPNSNGNGSFYSRLQKGNPNGTPGFNGDRIINTRNDGNVNNKQYVQPNGNNMPNGSTISERKEAGHIHLEPRSNN